MSADAVVNNPVDPLILVILFTDDELNASPGNSTNNGFNNYSTFTANL
jgi:hypothetical protein